MMPPPNHPHDRSLRRDDEDRLRREAIAWLAKLSDPEVTAEDQQACQHWQSQSPAHARIFEMLARVWNDPMVDSAAVHVAQAEPERIVQQIPARARRLRRALAFAACFAVLVSGVAYFDLVTRFQADYQTGVGERRTIRLPDQSLVTLNTSTAIATSFDGSVRQVRVLKGEAFFKVQHDAHRPFIVESEETATRAVGTEFVVRTRRGFDRVTVVEGIVDVSLRKESRITERLTAGSMVETAQGRLGQAHSVDVSTASAWLQGLLIVDGMPLAQVIEEVRRYYPGTIVLWNHEIGEKRVTGTYNVEDPAKILYLLTKTFPLKTVGLADRVLILF